MTNATQGQRMLFGMPGMNFSDTNERTTLHFKLGKLIGSSAVGRPLEVLRFIALLRGPEPVPFDPPYANASTITREIYTRGECGRLAVILRHVFPDLRIYEIVREHGECRAHVLVEVDGVYMDINGEYDVAGCELAEVTEAEIVDYVGNYDFDARGPMG